MGVLDVRVKADKNNDIDIEMQVVKQEYIADRILWYWSKLYSSSLDKGDSYNNLKKAICILFADFSINTLNNIKKAHTKWNIREEDYKEIILTDKLEIHIIEISKMNYEVKNNKELLSWIDFIKNPDKENISVMNDMIKKAKEELEKISQDEHERYLAQLREKALMDEIAIRDSGFLEGKEEGIKEGLKEGIKEGAKEKEIAIVKKMLDEKFDIKTISKITGLSEKEIAKIAEK